MDEYCINKDKIQLKESYIRSKLHIILYIFVRVVTRGQRLLCAFCKTNTL